MTYYNNKYFNCQKKSGIFGGKANLNKFEEYIKPEYNVIDFGCGGGYLLANLKCKGKIGIDINLVAQQEAASLGLTVYGRIEEVPDEWADLIISDNALEHTECPFWELKRLYPKLKKQGMIVFVVPCDSVGYRYKSNDMNQHLYSWSPMCLGNLFDMVGFKVLRVEPYIHKWPPYYEKIIKYFGKGIFNFTCRIYGRIERSWFQVRIVAKKI